MFDLLRCRPALLAVLLALGLSTGCDSSDDPPAHETLAEDIAFSVANALALQTNGALDLAADLALALDEAFPPSTSPLTYASDVTRTYRYDGSNTLWRISAEGTRGERGTDFFARIRRGYNVTFLAADGRPISSFNAPNDQAARIETAITSGTSDREVPDSNSRLTGMSGALTVTDLDTPSLTVNGTVTLSGLDRIARAGDVFVALSYTLALTFDNVRGPADGRSGWASEATGRLTGTYTAVYSREVGGNLTETPIERTVEVNLEDGNGLRALRLLFGDQVFRANIETGLLETLAP
ncbi:MAG: hypothetical protein AAGG50_15280 [Bacteroidota bacterium]